jgi:hypothetical protein
MGERMIARDIGKCRFCGARIVGYEDGMAHELPVCGTFDRTMRASVDFLGKVDIIKVDAEGEILERKTSEQPS